MKIPLYIIDSFTEARFGGNPAAVCLLEQPLSEGTLGEIAAEMNLSETAFVLSTDEGMELRWFTPKAEVDLCGHATLAAAHALWQSGALPRDARASFMTKSGQLTASLSDDGGWIQMDFPSEPPDLAQAPEELIQCLGLIPRYVGRNRMDYIVEVDNEETVRTLRPDFGMMKGLQTRGVVVTSRASQGAAYDFVSRAFFPALGVNEDPVTGSAHCALAPYWGKRLRKEELIGYQASARGGIVAMHIAGERVLLSGKAVTVVRGELEL